MNISKTSKGGLLAFCLVGLSSVCSAAGPIGELEIRGASQITQASRQGTISLRDTTYGWFSGDQISTRNGEALLNLDNGASFGFGRNTVVSLSMDGGVAVQLDSGVLLYAIEDSVGSMSLVSGEYSFSTRSESARILQVSDEPSWSMGMVQRMEDGSLEVSVRQGVLQARDISGATQFLVNAGETASFADGRIEQVQVQVQAADNVARQGGFLAWVKANPLLTGLGLVAGGYGLYRVAFSSSGSSEPDPVSP